jgi:hypothetical protein
MGKSLSTDPSIQRCGDVFHGTSAPVRGSLAKMEAGEKMNGTEHDAALENVRYLKEKGRANDLGP